jgi:hypothetical protein
MGGGNQTGFTSTIWQTFSDDGGATFRGPPTPTSLITHDAPTLVLRLERAAHWMEAAGIKPSPTFDPIVMMWTNNRQGPGRRISEASRMLLHAALSVDDGETFVGHIQVMRDPLAKVAISHSGSITDDYGAFVYLWS